MSDAGEHRHRQGQRGQAQTSADLPRVEHRREPEDTNCPMHGCGRPIVRVGQYPSGELDTVLTQYFVHRHIIGKWPAAAARS